MLGFAIHSCHWYIVILICWFVKKKELKFYYIIYDKLLYARQGRGYIVDMNEKHNNWKEGDNMETVEKIIIKIKREHEKNILAIQTTFNKARLNEAKQYYNRKGVTK